MEQSAKENNNDENTIMVGKGENEGRFPNFRNTLKFIGSPASPKGSYKFSLACLSVCLSVCNRFFSGSAH